MSEKRKLKRVRNRLMAGVFCISLLFSDLVSVIPVWAQETVVAEQTQSSGENESEEAMDPDKDAQGEAVQDPDENNGGETAPIPDEGNEEDTAQNPEEGNVGDDTQVPDEGNDGDDIQNPDAEDVVTDDTAEEPDLPEEEELTDAEEMDSVSENDPEEQGEVRALAASGNNIASGTYKDTTWVIDANGKLTVEGTGDFSELSVGDYFTDGKRAPWYNKREHIKSAEIKVTGMTDTSYMFESCYNMTDVTFEGSDTSMVTNMKGMFRICTGLKHIDFGQGFHTEKVTDMSSMFDSCSALEELTLGQYFHTENVTNMSSMFQGCRALKKLTLGQHFQTGNVTNMSAMFLGCNNLSNVDLSGFNTSNVTKMNSLFSGCLNWSNLDLSMWDTAKVTDMYGMFGNCGFHQITLGGSFTTQNVTDMRYMFACNTEPTVYGYYIDNQDRCDLKGLDLSWLDLSSEPSLFGIFGGCNVKQLDLSRLDTSKTGKLIGLFADCDLTGMDFSKLRTDTITDMRSMFRNSRGKVDLHTLNTDHVTDMSYMFGTFFLLGGGGDGGYMPRTNRFTEIDLSGLNTENVTRMAGMFSGQNELINVKINSLDTANVIDAEEMFYECKSLESIDLSNLNFGELICTDNFFYKCEKLTTIYTPYNVKYYVSLPDGDWYMADGTTLEYNCLPRDHPYSVLIQKDSAPIVSETRMEISKKKTLYDCNETINTDDLTVRYYGTDGSVKKLTEEEYTTNAASLSTAEPGTVELVVTYTKDGKTLTEKITLTIAYVLSSGNTEITLPAEDAFNFTYDGQPKTLVPTAVSYIRKAADGTQIPVALTEGTDYAVSYRNHINAGEESDKKAPTVIIKGAGKYSGVVEKTFTIKKAAAPEAEGKDITASRCTQANVYRTIDLSESFAAYGKQTGYEILGVDDPKRIFRRTPVTADIQDGILTYVTNAAQEDDAATIRIKVSFVNYEDAELTVKITMVAKRSVVISGITMPEDITYSGTAVTYGGAASVAAEDGTNVTNQVTLVYRYSGTMADGTPYPAQSGTAGAGSQTTEEAPVNAGRYVLTVAVKEDDPEYTGSAEYPFTISPAAATVRAGDIVDVMQGNQGASKPVASYQSAFRYDIEGLLNDDRLDKEPVYTVTDMEGQAVAQIDMTKESVYNIVPSGADAGMNYAISYVNGTLTVTAERVVYTVRFDCMGHGGSFTKSGIKAGSLLALSESELTPAAEGYLFAGWYKDQSFAKGKEWNFDTDTVQSDLTLYACWLTAASADSGLQLCVQEIPDLTYTGSALKPAVTVYDSDGKTLLKSGKDYIIKYVRNTNAVKIGTDGQPEQGGGTAKVKNPGKANEKITNVIGEFSKECPYVVITGKGNYTETVYRNFRILPADISEAALKYTDQFEAKAGKTAKIVNSLKYKKALKDGKDYTISVQDESGAPVTLTQGKLPLKAGNYELNITGTGNYTGTVRRSLYVADKKNLMKNASVTYAKTIQAKDAEDLKKGIEQSNVTVKISGKPIDAANYTIDYAGTNHAVGTATMILTGKNGYVGSKSVTFKITGMPFGAKTVEVKTDNGSMQDGSGWKEAMTYTGRALTQNKVTLTAKADSANPTARELTYGEDYTITYKNNVKKGTATMTFTAKPESGYSGSFKKNFKINAQELSEDMFVEKLPEYAVHSAGGASLDFRMKNAEGMELKQGTDYTVSYKNNKAATKENADSAVKAGSKQPVMTIKGKGSYAGTLTVEFQIIPASIDSAQLTVTAAQVQKKNGMKLKDFKLKVTDGKTVLKAGKDYTIDESGCTPEIIQAYADSLGSQDTAGAGMPAAPKVVLKGMGNYGMQGESATREISLADYIYATKLTSKNLKVEVTGSTTYTGQNIEPAVKVSYYKDNNAAKQDAVGVELTNGTDYKITYGSKNISAGKKKGSITITGAGVYGGSVTVKFDIDTKAIY